MVNDLNNLITVVNSYAEMLLNRKGFSDEAVEWIKQIYLAGERASELTRQLSAARPQTSTQKQTMKNNEVADGGKEVVPVVEDEEQVRTLAALVLQKQGYRVLEAESSAEAMDVWERHHSRIDALVTDMVMPGDMPGRELAAQLQKQGPGLKVIYTTGYLADIMDDEQQQDCRENLVILHKPCLPRELAQTLRTVLNSDEPAH